MRKACTHATVQDPSPNLTHTHEDTLRNTFRLLWNVHFKSKCVILCRKGCAGVTFPCLGSSLGFYKLTRNAQTHNEARVATPSGSHTIVYVVSFWRYGRMGLCEHHIHICMHRGASISCCESNLSLQPTTWHVSSSAPWKQIMIIP